MGRTSRVSARMPRIMGRLRTRGAERGPCHARRLRETGANSQEMRGPALSRISGPKRWPGGGVARGIHPDLRVGGPAPDAAGDHPPGKPRVGGAGGVGGEHRGGRGRHIGHRRGEALFGDGDDLRLRAEAAAAAALATGGPFVARLGVAWFAQVRCSDHGSGMALALSGGGQARVDGVGAGGGSACGGYSRPHGHGRYSRTPAPAQVTLSHRVRGMTRCASKH